MKYISDLLWRFFDMLQKLKLSSVLCISITRVSLGMFHLNPSQCKKKKHFSLFNWIMQLWHKLRLISLYYYGALKPSNKNQERGVYSNKGLKAFGLGQNQPRSGDSDKEEETTRAQGSLRVHTEGLDALIKEMWSAWVCSPFFVSRKSNPASHASEIYQDFKFFRKFSTDINKQGPKWKLMSSDSYFK